MDYEIVIGLEVHAQLQTRSKMFCGCSSDYAGAEPNSHVCPVCLGMPGVLPVINEQAVRYTIMTALALNCEIPGHSRFDRKNYPYPDLVKGYQISQYDMPLSRNGWLDVEVNGDSRRIGITRVHLEEDTAKLVHRSSITGEQYSLVDVNRSGVPLMEIVSEPDIRSAEEARQYLIKLRNILLYLRVSTGNMEEGSYRCDANISLRPKGSQTLMAKVEVKNMNSFKAVFQALEYEAQRQKKALAQGERIIQETRGWVDDKGITVSQRSKEFAHDYRYFPEPDLPPLIVSREWVEELRARVPELPDARKQRFVTRFGFSTYEAGILTSSREMADYFEKCVSEAKAGQNSTARSISNWLQGDFSYLLKEKGIELSQVKVAPFHLAELVGLQESGQVGGPAAKVIFAEMFETGEPPSIIMQKRGLGQISGTSELEQIVERVLADNKAAVEDFKAGKAQALTFLMGQVMKATRGRANPGVAGQLIKNKIGKE